MLFVQQIGLPLNNINRLVL